MATTQPTLGLAPHAEIVLLRELHEESIIRKANRINSNTPEFHKDYVRVTGEVTFIDAGARFCQLVRGRHDVFINLESVDMRGIQVGSMCQFFGTIVVDRASHVGTYPFHVVATIARVVDDLDLDLFEQALIKRRSFLAQPS
jgi:hypothetical protein